MELSTAMTTMNTPGADTGRAWSIGSQAIMPRANAKKAALRITPDRSAPVAPLPLP